MLINLNSLSSLLVTISSAFVPICNRFHTKRANNGKIAFLGVPLFDALVRGEFLHPGARNFVTKNKSLWGSRQTRFCDFMCRRLQGVTDGQAPRPWLRRAKYSAVARKNQLGYVIDLFVSLSWRR